MDDEAEKAAQPPAVPAIDVPEALEHPPPSGARNAQGTGQVQDSCDTRTVTLHNTPGQRHRFRTVINPAHCSLPPSPPRPLTEIFPGLEREFDLSNVGPLLLLTGYQTPAAIRRAGRRRLATWLRNRKARSADELAAKAVQAAEGQHTSVPGEDMTAHVVHSLAKEVVALNEKTAETDKLIEGRFRRHRTAEVIASMPGIGARWAPNSWPPQATTWPPSPARTGWPPSQASRRHPAIPGRSAATCTAPLATAGASSAFSAPPR